MKKTMILSSIAASVLAFATISYAAPEKAPVAPAAAMQSAVKVDMSQALAAAQAKFSEAKPVSASLHGTRAYGLVWDVRMSGNDGSAIRVFVNPEDGSILASDNFGIRQGPRGNGFGPGFGPGYGPGCGMGPGMGAGMGPGMGRGMGPGMNPDCPFYDGDRPRHHGPRHGGRHGGDCPWF